MLGPSKLNHSVLSGCWSWTGSEEDQSELGWLANLMPSAWWAIIIATIFNAVHWFTNFCSNFCTFHFLPYSSIRMTARQLHLFHTIFQPGAVNVVSVVCIAPLTDFVNALQHLIIHVHASRLWSVHGALLQTMLHHSEFTYGVDFNLHQPGEVSSLRWCHGVTRQMVSYSTNLNAFVLHHSNYILPTCCTFIRCKQTHI